MISSSAQSFLDKEILIEALHLDYTGDAYADTMLDHKVRQAIAVKKQDALRQMAHEVDGRGGESGRMLIATEN